MALPRARACPQAAKTSALRPSSDRRVPQPRNGWGGEAELQLAQDSLEQSGWCRVPGPNLRGRDISGVLHMGFLGQAEGQHSGEGAVPPRGVCVCRAAARNPSKVIYFCVTSASPMPTSALPIPMAAPIAGPTRSVTKRECGWSAGLGAKAALQGAPPPPACTPSPPSCLLEQPVPLPRASQHLTPPGQQLAPSPKRWGREPLLAQPSSLGQPGSHPTRAPALKSGGRFAAHPRAAAPCPPMLSHRRTPCP